MTLRKHSNFSTVGQAHKAFSYPLHCLLKIPPVAGKKGQDVEGMGKPLILA